MNSINNNNHLVGIAHHLELFKIQKLHGGDQPLYVSRYISTYIFLYIYNFFLSFSSCGTIYTYITRSSRHATPYCCTKYFLFSLLYLNVAAEAAAVFGRLKFTRDPLRERLMFEIRLELARGRRERHLVYYI